MYFYIFLSVCVTLAAGQVQMSGTCDPNVQAMQSFRIGKFEGRWYLAESLGDGSNIGRCPSVYLSRQSKKVVTCTTTFMEGTESRYIGGFAYTTDPGTINIDELPFTSAVSNKVPYKMLDTDYDTYGLLYYCKQDTPTTKTVYAMKYSRSQTLPADAVNEINSITSQYAELKDGSWVTSNHDNC